MRVVPYAPNRWDLITRFFESKEHPTLSLIIEAMRGSTQIGQPFNLPTAVLERFIPMVLGDSYDLYKEHGSVGLTRCYSYYIRYSFTNLWHTDSL